MAHVTRSDRWRLAPAALAFTALVLLPCAAAAQGLADLYRAALSGNPQLQSRGYDVDRARAESDSARSRLLPQLSAQGSWSTNEYRDALVNEQSYGGQRASLSARQALYDPASVRRLEATQSTILQREQEMVQTRLALLGEVLDRYLQALTAQDDQASLGAESQAASRQVDRLRAMSERQMAKVTDLAEAQAYVRSLATRTIDAGNDQAVALARLSELCGIPVKQVPALARTTFEPIAGTQQEWVASALRSHPRLLALTQALDAARRSVEASRAEHMPQVAATFSRVYSDQGYDNRQQPPYHSASLGVELRVPLYEGGRVDASVRDAIARQGVAEQQLEAARREIERETLTSWLTARANHARIGSTEAEVQAFEQVVQAQEKGLELGVSRITDVLDARRRLLKARADLYRARYDFIRDVAALKIRSGEVTDADVDQWDRWFASSGR